ncbi:hypothetical protein ACFE04_012179 [Oxalis oulophora]
MNPPQFVISSSDVTTLTQNSDFTSVLQLLPTLVKSAQSLARPPISEFSVAAVGYGSSGRIFIGVNLEFPGLPLNNSIHAEQFLVTNMYLNNESSLRSFAVSAPPCGHCRQFLQEMRNARNVGISILSTMANDDGDKYDCLANLLPLRFGPHDLLENDAPLLLEDRHNGLRFIDCEGDIGMMKEVALEAANKSYAPYSESPAGVALMDVEGKVYKGMYIESAAYNPSLGPVQAAIVGFVAGNGGGYERIVKAVLVEKEDAKIKQEDTTRLLLKSVSPKCELKIIFVFPYDCTCINHLHVRNLQKTLAGKT